MKILLLAGKEHVYITKILEKSKKTFVINKGALILSAAIEYVKEHALTYDKVLLTDSALFANPDKNERDLEALTELVEADVTIVTRDFLFAATKSPANIFVSPWFRTTAADFEEAIQCGGKNLSSKIPEIAAAHTEEPKKNREEYPKQPVGKKKISFSTSWNKKQEKESDLADISLAASKVIVFTGHRDSGITSTAVNVAITANRRGMRTILMDFDVDYRSFNLYFSELYELAEEDDAIAYSLIRLLAQPQSYQTMAVNVDGLWLTSLGYDFHDKRLLEQHFTESKIIALITSLKHNFDLIIIDFPLDGLTKFSAFINSVDAFALCMENSVYSAFTTLRNIVVGFNSRDTTPYFASKTRLVVTKYNDEAVYDNELITPERLSELIVSEEFCEDFAMELPVAGSVPYITWFGKQIESDISVIDMDNQMKQAYDGILLRLLGAAR